MALISLEFSLELPLQGFLPSELPVQGFLSVLAMSSVQAWDFSLLDSEEDTDLLDLERELCRR